MAIKQLQDTKTGEFIGEKFSTTIVYNAIKCKNCSEIIESTDEKNFVSCSCGLCSVDGGCPTEKYRRVWAGNAKLCSWFGCYVPPKVSDITEDECYEELLRYEDLKEELKELNDH